MKNIFALKSAFIILLVMICSTVKAETVEYTTDDGFVYSLDTETQEASFSMYFGSATEVVVPEKVIYEGKEYKVTSLGDGCFYDCSFLASIEIPSSVTSLGRGCFSGCSSLASIEIPSSVTGLGWYCFYGCSSLASIEIPSSVTSLGYCCFSNCSSLASIEIPSSVTNLGVECFSDCSSLASIEIPSSMTSLGIHCFSGCSSLASIVVDAQNPYYDSREGCNAIIETKSNIMVAGCKNTFIPSSVTRLGIECFFRCSSLASINIPSSVTSLGSECFYGCSSLASIEIPSSVTSLGDDCFSGCSSLASIVVDAQNPYYDSREGCNAIIETKSNTMVAGCKNTFIPSSVTSLERGCFSGCSLTSIEIPSSVTSLGDECFYDCSSLTSINIPSSVTSLGWYCFDGCSSLASIEIPLSVTSLGDMCFRDCSSLKTVICKMENVISGYFFYNFPIEDATLYVPDHLLETYKSTSPWSDFGTILPLSASGIDNNIFTDAGARFDVYSLKGILIKKDCSRDYLKRLSTGAYILRQGNISKKIIIRQ